jgi:hypothetical protein
MPYEYPTLTKGPGHTQRVAVEAVGGSDVIVDFAAVPVSTGTISIVPWSQIDIRPIAGAVRAAWLVGEITASRYFTIPSGAIRTIIGPGLASKLYLRGDVGIITVEVEVFE